MWLFVLEDPASGRRATAQLNEGLGKVLRYGAYSPEVLDRLRWMSRVLGPLLQAAVRRHGPVDVNAILAQMVQMGDEAHNRNRAGTLMLLRELLPSTDQSGPPSADVAEAVRFIGGNDHFFLNLAMPACKLALDAAATSPAHVVVAMARNGTDFGIRTSGTGDALVHRPRAGPRGSVPRRLRPRGRQPGHRRLGDHRDGRPWRLRDGRRPRDRPLGRRHRTPTPSTTTRLMYEITLAEHPAFTVPVLDFRGTPPASTSPGCPHRHPAADQHGHGGKVAGTGQVGAGLVTPPLECFTAALSALSSLAPGAEDF